MRSSWLYSMMKKMIWFILALGITIPIYYDATDPQYLIIRTLHSLLSLKHSVISNSTHSTLSADCRAFESLLRLQPVVNSDLKADPATTVKQFRSSFSFGTMIPRPSRCRVTKQIYTYNDHTVNAFWVNHHHGKELTNTDRIVLYLHGGGYFVGDISSYVGFECHLSDVFNRSVIHLEYRLLPEHSILDIIEDVVTLYRALLRDGISPSRIIIMGDSAGGGLSITTIQTLLSRNLPTPGGVIPISPFADVSLKQDSFKRNSLTDLISNLDILEFVIHLMCNSHAQLTRDDPRVSPLHGSFKGFPPMYITVGTGEMLEDISRETAEKALAAGVDVTFEAGEHLQHDYPLFFHYFPEARNSLDRMHQWIETKLKDNIIDQ